MNKLRGSFQGQNNTYIDKVVRRVVKFLTTSLSVRSGYNFVKLLEYNNLPQVKYLYYYLFSTLLKREYVAYLANNNFELAYKKKIRWAGLILQYSDWKIECAAAHDFLRILSKNGYTKYQVSMEYSNVSFKEVDKISSEKFYLYGPNSQHPPNIKYKDCIIVLTKDIENNIDKFKDSILFLNSIYYHEKIKNNSSKKNQLLQKYGKIYINSMHVINDKNINYSIIPPGSELCSPMALGRILYNLVIENGRFKGVIEGYDMYLEEESYSKFYPTLARNNNEIDEKMIVRGISNHDPLYNFLMVKELIQYVNLIDSDIFLKIIKMSGNEYMERLIDVRKFELLN
jgi:hypothetical protein